jgi:hypothetical protein
MRKERKKKTAGASSGKSSENWKVRKKEPNKKCGIKLISNKKIR